MYGSKYMVNYDKDFVQNNFISCEKEICKRLNWNFHQLTPFHFFQNLVSQGVFEEGVGSPGKKKNRKRGVYQSVNDSESLRKGGGRGLRAYSQSKNHTRNHFSGKCSCKYVFKLGE